MGGTGGVGRRGAVWRFREGERTGLVLLCAVVCGAVADGERQSSSGLEVENSSGGKVDTTQKI